MTNADIAAVFDHVADLIEYQGGNVFRVRAYRNAARTIGSMVESLATVRADPARALTDIEGVGADLAAKIGTLLDTGRLPLLDELQREIPAVVFELMRVPGLGPKKVKTLVDELGIDSLDALEQACRAGRVREVKGFGAKTEAAILENIGFAKSPEHDRLLWSEADAIVQQLLAWMRECPAVRRAEGAGSWRRGRETVGDIDVVVDTDDAAAVMDHLVAWRECAGVLLRGDTKTSIRGPRGVQVDLRVVEHASFGAAWQYFTGSKEHNVRLLGRAPPPAGSRSTNTACSASRQARTPMPSSPRERRWRAEARRTSMPPSACPGFHPKSAKGATRSAARNGASCPISSPSPTSAATCTCTPPRPTARTRSPPWFGRRSTAASPTSRSPITVSG
jgi:DNA polymerase (family 10)